MNPSMFNLFLVVVIEAIVAVVAYLADCLMGNLRRSSDDEPWANPF